MNKIKKIAASSKEFVQRHKVAIAITVTTLTCMTVQAKTMRAHNEFLKEHDLFDQYYHAEEV